MLTVLELAERDIGICLSTKCAGSEFCFKSLKETGFLNVMKLFKFKIR